MGKHILEAGKALELLNACHLEYKADSEVELVCWNFFPHAAVADDASLVVLMEAYVAQVQSMPLFSLHDVAEQFICAMLTQQSSRISTAVMQHFFSKLSVMAYMDTLHQHLLLMDSDFRATLTTTLFSDTLDNRLHLYAKRTWPPESWELGRLNQLMPDVLSFTVKTDADCNETKSIRAFHFLAIDFSIPFPVSILITSKILDNYNRVWTLLLQLLRVGESLKSAQMVVFDAFGHDRRVLGFMQQCRHFLNGFMEYIAQSAIEPSIKQFKRVLNGSHSAIQAQTLAECHDLHLHMTDRLLDKCLLRSKQHPIMAIVQFQLQCMLDLSLLMHNHTTKRQGTQMTRVRIIALHERFMEGIPFLMKAIGSMGERQGLAMSRIRASIHTSRIVHEWERNVENSGDKVAVLKEMLLRVDGNGWYT
jgi:hypothetical protein